MRKECTGYRMVCGVFGILLSTYSGCVGISVCDLDQDGWCLPDDCDPLESQINPDQVEVCNGVDDDCDGEVDEGVPSDLYPDQDGDGYGADDGGPSSCAGEGLMVAVAGDCDDTNAAIHPEAQETCNGLDDDCDGVLDELDGSIPYYYEDQDGDGFGDPDRPLVSCDGQVSYAANDLDCDDGDGAVYPEALEGCDAIDNDCDGVVTQETQQVQRGGRWYEGLELALDAEEGTEIGICPGTYRDIDLSGQDGLTLKALYGPDTVYFTTSTDSGIEIFESSNLWLVDLNVEDNLNGENDRGGGLWIRDSLNINLEGLSVAGNTTSMHGAGIYCNNTSLTLTDVTLISNRLSANEGKKGGGIYIRGDSEVALYGGVVADNYEGSGIFIRQDDGDGYLIEVWICGTYLYDNAPGQVRFNQRSDLDPWEGSSEVAASLYCRGNPTGCESILPQSCGLGMQQPAAR